MNDGLLISLITAGIVVLFILGVPIFLLLGFWVIGVSLVIGFTLANVGITLFEGIFSFSLLALPLFILTGDLLKASGIARRLTEFANSIIGWAQGGAGMTALGASGLFAAVSGSNTATTAAIGSITYPEMIRQGYKKEFSGATIAAGGIVGVIIPPSIVLIVYGVLMGLPVGDLFIAGLIPGALLVVSMQIVCYYLARKNSWGGTVPFVPLDVLRSGARAYLGLLAIGLILYGIYGGIFSPTEAGGITVGFCLIAGLAITRELRFSQVPSVIFRAAKLTGLIAPLVAISIVMQQLFSVLGVEDFVANAFAALPGDKVITLIGAMLVVLFFGMFLESIPNTLILAPILAPIAVGVGVDPIHFAIIFVVGGAIGFITPPYGLNLYVASGITGIPYFNLLRYSMAYLIGLIVAWVLISFVPALSLSLAL